MVYFIFQEQRYVKIGYTVDRPFERLGELQVGNPHTMRLEGLMFNATVGDERAIHDRFKQYLLRGEWYLLSPEIIGYMHKHCDEVDLGVDSSLVAATDRLAAIRQALKK
jgi:hypothetical protein